MTWIAWIVGGLGLEAPGGVHLGSRAALATSMKLAACGVIIAALAYSAFSVAITERRRCAAALCMGLCGEMLVAEALLLFRGIGEHDDACYGQHCTWLKYAKGSADEALLYDTTVGLLAMGLAATLVVGNVFPRTRRFFHPWRPVLFCGAPPARCGMA